MSITILYRYDTWVKAATGPAISGAQVWVCTQPANVLSSTSPIAPSPLASIFADSGGLVPITQPLLTDGFGHADFYAEPGLYTVVVATSSTVQTILEDQSIGNVGTQGGGGGSAVSGLTLEVNGTDNVVQSVLNLTSGANISLLDNGNGSVTITGIVPPSAPGLGYLASYKPIHGAMTSRGGLGQIASGYEVLGSPTSTGVNPTSSHSTVINYACNGTNVTIDICDSGAEATSEISLGSLVWAGCEFIAAVNTNGRYWLAATNLNGGTSSLESDAPTTIPLVGFRWSSGTDTNWQCVTGNGSNLTIVNSGVAIDTVNQHVFQIFPTSSGTSVNFYIDGTLVATISTTLPSASTGLNWGLHLDNKGTSSSPSFTLFSILYQTN